MTSLTIGVAIITFNGLKYLPQQLESIVTQTRAVDHIAISDDRSTDGTWEFLEAWARQAPMRVTLIRNDPQLGLTRNFEQSIAALEEDLIFTSDQDDVWVPDKVALVAAVFDKQPEVLLAHTDAILVDAEGQDMGKTLFGELGLTNAERRAIQAGKAFSVNCRRNVVTGATAAFRRSLLPLVRPFPLNMFHDAWLVLVAATAGKVVLLNVPTIHYRQHGSNVVGVRKLSKWMQLRHLIWQIRGPRPVSKLIDDTVAWRTTLQERLAALPHVPLPARAFADETLAFYRGRRTLPAHPVVRTLAVLRHVLAGRYRKFSYTPKSDAIRDALNK